MWPFLDISVKLLHYPIQDLTTSKQTVNRHEHNTDHRKNITIILIPPHYLFLEIPTFIYP